MVIRFLRGRFCSCNCRISGQRKSAVATAESGDLPYQSYGVATYTTPEDVPDELRDALLDIDDLKALLER